MKIKIVVNEHNYILSYATVGSIDGSIEIEYNGELSDIKNYQYINGKLIRNEIPPKEGYKSIYNGIEWIELATLEECIELKRLELKGCRDYENNACFKDASCNLFDADENSKRKLERAELKYRDIEEELLWITSDNKTVSVNYTKIKEILTGIYIREDILFKKFTDKLDIIINSKTIEEVKNIVWEA